MKLRIFTSVFGIILFFSGILALRSQAQSYGLGFYGQEVVQDQRTGLELGTGEPLCVGESFTISFELSFLTNRADYFGYIVRIIDEEGNNIDLIYDRRDVSNKHFRLVKGDKFSSIAFELDTLQLYGKWTKLTFAFEGEQTLHFSCGKKEYTEKVAMNSKGCFRVLFGLNDVDEFKTTDVPAMKIREVKVSEGKKPAYYWPLNQVEGSVAREVINGRDAAVANPMWLKKKYMEWQLLHTHTLRGEASVAFDQNNERVYVVGADSLLSYTVPGGKATVLDYRSDTLFLVNGSQSVFDTTAGHLLNFCVDQRIVSAFDSQTRTWDSNYFHPAPGTNFLHLNKFYSASDSSIYFIGGYGHFLYKDSVFRYHVPSKNWDFIRPEGDRFTPRYLAALGASEKGAYIVGGYGSTSGQQMLNPRNLYDFLYFNPREKTFKKKFELNVQKEDFVFANSLVIDEAAGCWYGLIFPQHKYHSSLQLIRGSLSDSTFSLAANEIPYLFHDVHSFADLFYCPASKRFVAVTIFRDDAGMSTVKIYSLFSPPLPPGAFSALVPAGSHGYLFVIISLPCLLFLSFLYLRKKRRKGKRRNPETASSAFPQSRTPEFPQTVPAWTERRRPHAPMESESGRLSAAAPETAISPVNAVFLFGDLQLFNREGKDISAHFSPLLKELFLILLLHTVKGGKGVSSKKLTELLWFDKSDSSARNNRAVNIAKLKSIICEIGDNSGIVKEGGYWKLKFDKQQVYIDYRDYLEIIGERKQLDKQRIIALSEIVRRGSFLPQADYEWLDPFKSELSNEITDTYIHFAGAADSNTEPEFLVEVANYISCFDPLNEDAMMIKCKALAKLGKHSLATQAFESFCKKYRQIYGEEFNRDFKSVIL